MIIGFFHPSNLLAVDIITLLEKFSKDGHKVILITMQPKGELHGHLKNKGLVFEFLGSERKSRYQYYIGNGKKLASICEKHKIDFLYNNLAESQLIALFSRFYRRVPMVYYRHFPDHYMLYCTRKERVFEKIISKLSTHILVPSATCIPFLKKYQGIPAEKVTAINLTYSLNYYDMDAAKALQLKQEKEAEGNIILISLARMIPIKRIELQLELAVCLKSAGIKFKFFILGQGPLLESIKKKVKDLNLNDCCIMPGFIDKVMTYLSVADVLIHTSEFEASSHVVKEAGLMKKIVICCNEVGDFNTYLINEKNSFLVDKDNPVHGMLKIIKDINAKKIDTKAIGESLCQTVKEKFTVEHVIDLHYKMIKKILND